MRLGSCGTWRGYLTPMPAALAPGGGTSKEGVVLSSPVADATRREAEFE